MTALRVAVVGAAGRMGAALIRVVTEAGDTLIAAREHEGSPAIGMDAGLLAGLPPIGVRVDAADDFAGCDAVIDFTSPAASAALTRRLADARVPHVVGTTGFDEAHEDAFRAAAASNAIVKSGNMSLGVNLLAALVRQAANALPDADCEIVEMHHARKVDAPSGTALLLGGAAAAGRDVSLKDRAVFAREGQTGAREPGTIGFATLRGGTVVGEHAVILAMAGERIVLSHTAEDRAIFARGALSAARWVRDQPPGHYTMANVLGVD